MLATNPEPFKNMTKAPRGDATDGKTLKIEGTGTTSMPAHDAETERHSTKWRHSTHPSCWEAVHN
jgi:hypothetical protein